MCYWVETALSARVGLWSHRAAASAANVALGNVLLIPCQAVAVPMEDTLALGADNWMGSNADGTGAPGANGPRVHHERVHPALRRSSRRCWAGWAAPSSKRGVVRLS